VIDGADTTLDAMERVAVNEKNRPLHEIKIIGVSLICTFHVWCLIAGCSGTDRRARKPDCCSFTQLTWKLQRPSKKRPPCRKHWQDLEK
jgi:hypothetical protein